MKWHRKRGNGIKWAEETYTKTKADFSGLTSGAADEYSQSQAAVTVVVVRGRG